MGSILRTCVFDLETSDLKADVGRILVGSILDGDTRKITTFRNDRIGVKSDLEDDSEIARRISEELQNYHIICGWNSKQFDVPFLNTRLAVSGQPVLPRHKHVDGVWYFKGWRGLKPRNARLGTVAELLGVGSKTHVDVKTWIEAMLSGDVKRKQAMDILCQRCEDDVIVTADVIGRAFDIGIINKIEVWP